MPSKNWSVANLVLPQFVCAALIGWFLIGPTAIPSNSEASTPAIQINIEKRKLIETLFVVSIFLAEKFEETELHGSFKSAAACAADDKCDIDTRFNNFSSLAQNLSENIERKLVQGYKPLGASNEEKKVILDLMSVAPSRLDAIQKIIKQLTDDRKNFLANLGTLSSTQKWFPELVRALTVFAANGGYMKGLNSIDLSDRYPSVTER